MLTYPVLLNPSTPLKNLARVWHASGTRQPLKKSIEPRLVVLVGLVQDMARSAELKLTHVDEFKLTHVAASITSSKVL